MNKEEIKKILPHRDDMLLIDEAETARLMPKERSPERNFSFAVIFPEIPSFPA